VVVTKAPTSTTASFGCGGRANNNRSFINSLSVSIRAHDFRDDSGILAVLRQTRAMI
jgi:hypothetical protein